VEHRELVVVGAGPAGLSAALEASHLSADVLVLDENERGGGQLFKQVHKFFGSRRHGAGKRGFQVGEELLGKCRKRGVEIKLKSLVVGIFNNNLLMVRDLRGISLIKYKAAILATGAAEKGLAFPGWTLPGVMGAGGAQTLMNLQGVLPGKRVAMVGSGNVGLIVAYQFVQAGAEIACVIEIADKVKGYQVHEYKLRKLGIPILCRHQLVRAEGVNAVTSIVVRNLESGLCFRYPVDCVCLAVGLAPNIELPLMLGCRLEHHPELGGWKPWHDSGMHTSCPGIYIAGDAAGVEEASIAMEEGKLAAISACHDLGMLSASRARRRAREIEERLKELRGGLYCSIKGKIKTDAKNM
jgi:NADPH-dependent 2,4-dienoyl-CoA reductase/sulfur reductase-like enzyme